MLEKVTNRQWEEVRAAMMGMHPIEAADAIRELPDSEMAVAFRLLPEAAASKVFGYLDSRTQQSIIKNLGEREVATILDDMSPDDRTVFLEKLPPHVLKEALISLSDDGRRVASALLGYEKHSVGRLMTPYYIQVRARWSVEETLEHIRKFGKTAETLNVIYVVNEGQQLVDDVRIGDLLMARPDTCVGELMDNRFVALTDTMDREEAVDIFRRYDRTALPVITASGVLVGIVTVDDILDVADAEATEDIQKFGGVEAFDLPYTETPLSGMVRKRAGWLIVLFLGEMLTASAMGYYDKQIERAVVLALFVPLIISSGGNSGSQAATLIIRAMSLKELALRDWWYVMRRELFSGISLGLILGSIGFARIAVWQKLGLFDYSEHWPRVALTIFLSLVGVVLWGTLSGSMIPFVLERFGLDPATSSAPFVATLVDVTGLIIYFSIATTILTGTLL